ncbi:MAG: DUF4142 domain-containing protein [Longimicrobiales bacterium]
MMRGRSNGLLRAAIVGLVVAGCGGDGTNAGAVADTANAPAQAAQAPAPLADAQVVHIARTANTVATEGAELAKAQSRNADVLRFADTVIADHAAISRLLDELMQRRSATPMEHALSRGLASSAGEARARLERLDSAAFDRAYLEREVAYHEALLGVFDRRLLPDAKDDELEALLENVRPAIEAHLRRARQLVVELGAESTEG